MYPQRKTACCILALFLLFVIALSAISIWLYGKTYHLSSEFPISYGNLRFDRIELDAGEVFEDDIYIFDFKFKNVSKKQISITKTLGTCSCTDVNVSPEIVQPDCIGIVQGAITFRGKNGRIEESTLMETADGHQYLLKLRANVRDHYTVTPSRVDFGDVWWDDKLEGSVTVNSHSPTDFSEQLSVAPGHHSSIQTDLTSLIDKEWTIKIKVDKPKTGLLNQCVMVKTTNPRQRNIFIPIHANVRKPINVKPKTLYLGTVSSEQIVPCQLFVTRRPGFNTEIMKLSASNITILKKKNVQFVEDLAKVEFELAFSEIEGLVEDNFVIETSSPQCVTYIPIVAFVQH